MKDSKTDALKVKWFHITREVLDSKQTTSDEVKQKEAKTSLGRQKFHCAHKLYLKIRLQIVSLGI